MRTSVIFTTYNAPEWLEKVLWGFFCQSDPNFELIIADDGSSDETRVLINRMRRTSPVPITHVWQEDDGFQKCRILNKAVLVASGDYLVFTDGDCIPRSDFVAQHVRYASDGLFLSGGYFKLPMHISRELTRQDIESGRAFDSKWLQQRGMRKSIKDLKLKAKGRMASILNAVSPAKASWNGQNASCFKRHVLAANGFDERMQYGGEDREFGLRLQHMGLRGRRIRYSAICLHLEHGHGYVTPDMRVRNEQIRSDTVARKATRAVVGLDQYQNTNPADFVTANI